MSLETGSKFKTFMPPIRHHAVYAERWQQQKQKVIMRIVRCFLFYLQWMMFQDLVDHVEVHALLSGLAHLLHFFRSNEISFVAK